jgi:hypothetical protein
MDHDEHDAGPREHVVVRWGRPPAERRAHAVTIGLLVVWLGIILSIRDHPEGLGPLGAGGILVLSGVFQRARGWHTGLLQWILGSALVFIGVGDLVPGWEDVPWGGLAVIAAGLFILWRATSRPRH